MSNKTNPSNLMS